MTSPLRFKGWQLLPDERVLKIGDASVSIGARAYDVLIALIAKDGAVVSKAELLDTAWAGLVVEENNLSVQVSALRKLLGADAISTVAGRGYRLSAAREAEGGTAIRGRRAVAAFMLFGRDDDLDRIDERLGVVPLLSIVGTGGVGKTAIAKTLFERRRALGDDDCRWVDLSPLRDASQIVPEIARALDIAFDGTGSQDEWMRSLVDVRALVGLDNCEHLLDGVADVVGELIEHAPGIRWLATSQEPLRLAGEFVHRLRPLDVPATDTSVDAALASGAVGLLAERAMRADRSFVLDGSNVETAIDLCRRLDGLPLAIEMAAARIATLGLSGVHEQLGRRLRLLAGPRGAPHRHLTLHSTLDWSYQLLSPDERMVFRRLEPFVDGFDAAMAEQVACDAEERGALVDAERVFEIVGALVEKSLVQRAVDGGQRFFLYESARAFARERLVHDGELHAVRLRHARVIAERFDESGSDLERLRDEDWSARYVVDHHNATAALDWVCRTEDPDLVARLVIAVARLDSFMQNGATEVVRVDASLDQIARASPRWRPEARLELGWAHYRHGQKRTGTELTLAAHDEFVAMRDTTGLYRSLHQLIRLYDSRPGMVDEAKRAHEALQGIDATTVPLRTRLICEIIAGMKYSGTRTPERLAQWQAIAQAAGFDSLVATCSVYMTDQSLIDGRHEDVVAATERLLAGETSRPRLRGILLINQVLALVQLRRYDEARAAARLALRTLPNRTYLVFVSFALGAAREGHPIEAAMMVGHIERVIRERDEALDPAETLVMKEVDARLATDLSPARVAESKGIGSAMTLREMTSLALLRSVTAGTRPIP